MKQLLMLSLYFLIVELKGFQEVCIEGPYIVFQNLILYLSKSFKDNKIVIGKNG
jgi:hypothetical protein